MRRSCAHWRRRGPFCDPAPDRVLALAIGGGAKGCKKGVKRTNGSAAATRGGGGSGGRRRTRAPGGVRSRRSAAGAAGSSRAPACSSDSGPGGARSGRFRAVGLWHSGALGAIDVGSGGSAAYLVGRPGLDALRGDLRLASGCGPGPDVRPVVFAGARVQLQVLVLAVDRRGERFCRRSARPLCPILAKMAPIGPKTAKSRKMSGAGEIRPHRKRSKRRFRPFRYYQTLRFRPCGWRRWRSQEAGPQARHSSRSPRAACLSVYEGRGRGWGGV